jgi:hypothetical protein
MLIPLPSRLVVSDCSQSGSFLVNLQAAKASFEVAATHFFAGS